MENELNLQQKKILREFIQAFLPATKSKSKKLGNELDYIHTTLDKVFIQNFGFNLPRQIILKTFKELGHSIYTMNGEEDYETREVKPSKNGTIMKTVGRGKSDLEAYFTFIGISVEAMRYLRRSTATLSPNTNMEKLLETQKLKEEIKEFAKAMGGKV